MLGRLLSGKAIGTDELVVRDTKFLDADENIDWEKWAPNGGRVPGTIKENQTIPAGTIIDRYGSQWGKYTSPAGVPYEQRALPYIENPNAYHKYEVLKQSLDNYRGDRSPHDIIRYFGGLEMVMVIGAMLQAAELGIVIMVDGFIMTNCILAASKLYPEVLHYAIFGHCGDETGHKLLLDHMKARPLLNLGLRLGEGTGAICAYPIVQSAIRMINEMDNFAHASITKYF